jgi:hypothetical protein
MASSAGEAVRRRPGRADVPGGPGQLPEFPNLPDIVPARDHEDLAFREGLMHL